ncbi:MAG: hypothetical protein Fur0032_22800 [Terrimicrobiaceae bacterium]
MKKHRIILRTACLTLTALIALPMAMVAAEIDFEMDEGYDPDISPVGVVTDAGRWYGKANFGEITPGEGFEGSQSLRIPPTGEFASMSFDPGFEKIPAKMRFSTLVKLEELEEGSFLVPLRLRLALDGDAEAVRIHFYAGGKVEFFANEKIVRALEANGDQFMTRSGVFTEVEVELDFEKSAYRLKLNDVQQKFEGSDWIPFQNTNERTRVGRLELTNSHLTVGGVHLDRIRWTADE